VDAGSTWRRMGRPSSSGTAPLAATPPVRQPPRTGPRTGRRAARHGKFLDFDGSNDRYGMNLRHATGGRAYPLPARHPGELPDGLRRRHECRGGGGQPLRRLRQQQPREGAYCTSNDTTADGDLSALRLGWRDVWQVLAWRYDPARRPVYLYKNGVLVGSDSNGGTCAACGRGRCGWAAAGTATRRWTSTTGG